MLLRSCAGINKIYLLIRSNEGVSSSQTSQGCYSGMAKVSDSRGGV